MEERSLAEKELSHSEERFAKAFQACPIPMAIQSLTTDCFLDVNEAFLSHERLPASRNHQPHARRTRSLPRPEDAAAAAVATQRRTLRAQLRVPVAHALRRDSRLRVSAEAFMLGDEAVALVATQDVSEQRKLEKQLRHSQKLEAVGQFAAAVATTSQLLTVIQGTPACISPRTTLKRMSPIRSTRSPSPPSAPQPFTRQLLTFSRKQIVQLQVLDVKRRRGQFA